MILLPAIYLHQGDEILSFALKKGQLETPGPMLDWQSDIEIRRNNEFKPKYKTENSFH